MRRAIYPGTFDPLTLGHVDVIARAQRIFTHLTVAVAEGVTKQPLFTVKERVAMIQDSVHDMPNVEIEGFSGLLVDYVRRVGANVIVRGLRAFSDFEYEFQMALTNRKMAPDIEAVFLMPKEDYSYLSSSMVREVAALGGDITEFVPAPVLQALQRKLRA